jgi:bacteriocin biosynthesis cyclodehydratase domain-containing protein
VLLLLRLSAAGAVSGIPRLPLLAPWYRLTGSDDRLLLEHGQTVVALEGGAVRTLLPALLPLLDGTRTYDDLLDRVGPATRPALDLALEVLATHDLLVEGPDVGPDLRNAAHAVAAAYGISPTVAEERLSGAVVDVVGSAPAAAEIARLLRLCGLGTVRRGRGRPRGRADLAVVAFGGDELEQLRRWNDKALARGVPWLPFRQYDGRFAAVGPLIVPGESCCYECVLRRRASNLEYGQHLAEIERVPVAAQADAALEALAVGVAAHLAVQWIGGRDATLPGVLHAVEARPTLSVGLHPVLRLPRCPACSPTLRLAAPLPWHEAEAAA